MTTAQQEWIKAVVAKMLAMPPEDRLEVIDAISNEFCFYCGDTHAQRQRCQCNNDE